MTDPFFGDEAPPGEADVYEVPEADEPPVTDVDPDEDDEEPEKVEG